MNIRLWTGIILLMMVTGCGSAGTPTRKNDFTPLTSIQISAKTVSIAQKTSIRLTAMGNFSGFFTDDISNQVIWTSATPEVADFTAPNSNRVLGKSPGTAILTATKGNVNATFTLTVTSATITDMTISPLTPSIPQGLSRQFTASGSFSNATTQDLTEDAVWTSSDPTVATVSTAADGTVLAQALTVGATTISAAFDGITRETQLTVTAPVVQSIAIEPANPSVLSVSRKSFLARGHFSDGTTSDITSQVTWSSAQTSIATISTTGTATTLVPGTAAISASLGSVSGSTNLRVTGGNLTAIAVTPATPSLVPGTVARMTATGTFGTGQSRDISGMVTWTVANTAVATITTPGGNLALLNALQTTTAQVDVKAAFGAITGTTTLTVPTATLQSITIAPKTLDLSVASSNRFTVTGAYSDNTTRDLTLVATWTSADPAVAAIGDAGNDKGRVSGLTASATPVTITATFDGKTDNTATVTVKQRTLQNLTITRSSTAQTAGSKVDFTVTANYSDNSTQDVTEDAVISIDPPNVALLPDNINFPKQVWLVDAGSATYTASFGGKTQTAAITVP